MSAARAAQAAQAAQNNALARGRAQPVGMTHAGIP
jgi:hypothetical protein